jgi:hypothetical protein
MEQETGALDVAWYTRREGVVRGPFAAEIVTRYILLGRIRLDDELSHDQVSWRMTRTVASLLPAEMANLQGWKDYQQLVEARMHADERRQERRCAQCTNHGNCHPERRSSTDRRKGEDRLLIDHYLAGKDQQQLPRQRRPHRLRALLISLLLATLVLAMLAPGWR